MKPVHYQPHVLYRMAQRTIERQQIEVAIREPHITLPTLDRRRSRAMRKFGTRTLDVIYEDRGRYVMVITAAWLKSEDRKVWPNEHSD